MCETTPKNDGVPPEETIEGVYTVPPLFPSLTTTNITTIANSSTVNGHQQQQEQQEQQERHLKLDDHHEELNRQRDELYEKLSKLSHEQLIKQLIDTQYSLHEWRHAASDLLSVLALSPEMTDIFYARSVRTLLKSALESLDSVDCLQHVECSMPSVHTERPMVNIIRWDGIHYSEWHVIWSPKSWWISVSADGSRWGLAFNCLANVSSISLDATIQCSFSNDLTALRLRFSQKPSLKLRVETTVGWGVVPLPVQESIQEIIKEKIEQFVDVRLRNDQGMIIVLRRKPLQTVSAGDIYEATMQAKRANNIRLRSSTFF